jgi:hypothetical protein
MPWPEARRACGPEPGARPDGATPKAARAGLRAPWFGLEAEPSSFA